MGVVQRQSAGPAVLQLTSDCDSHDGRAQLPGGGGGRVWAVSHRLHGGVSDGDGPRDDAQQGLSLQKCDKVRGEVRDDYAGEDGGGEETDLQDGDDEEREGREEESDEVQAGNEEDEENVSQV